MNNKQKSEVIKKCIKVLNKGGVILYPTDTIWGIGCDATNSTAIKKVYSIKERKKGHPLILLMHDIDTLKKYVVGISNETIKIVENIEKPTTIIYDSPINLPTNIIYKKTVAVRITKDPTLKRMINTFQKPITSTSANISGTPPPSSFEDINEKIKRQVDFIIPQDFIDLKNRKNASRIIKIQNDSNIKIIRE